MQRCMHKRLSLAFLVCAREHLFPFLFTSELRSCSRKSLIAPRVVGMLLVAALALLSSSVFVPPGMAQTCTANIPHIEGEWRTLPYLMPINPVSATLLHTGQVLIVAGSENDALNNSPDAESYSNAIWDPTGTTQNSVT